MDSADLASKLDQLTPENLVSIFCALLLCEISVNHIQNGLPENTGQLIDPFSDDVSVGQRLEGGFRRSIPSESTYVGLSRVA